MIRAHHSMPWRCCGVARPAQEGFCPWCGSSVLTVDRVLLRFPLPNQGDIAVVANAYPDAESWQSLIDMATAAKRAFRDRAPECATNVQPNPVNDETAPKGGPVT